MNICFICNEYPPVECGGIGIFVKEIAERLVAEGNTVTVVGLYTIQKSFKEQIAGVQIVRLKKYGGLCGVVLNRMQLYYFVKKMVERGVELVEAPDFEGITALWPKLNAPLVIRLHGSSTFFSCEMKQKPSTIVRYFEKKALIAADSIIAVSQYAGAQTNALFGLNRAYEVIYNGVTMPLPELRKKEYLSTGLVVFAGTTMSRKGIYALARVWPTVKERCPLAELFIVGKMVTEDGQSVVERVKKIAGVYSSSIQCIGFVPKEVVQKYFIQADVAVFPSYSETFGLAALEAMSLGVPVIYTTRSCGPEIAGNIQGAVLNDPDDSAGLAAEIIKFLESKEYREVVGTNYGTSVGEMYNPKQILVKNSMFWKKCIAERGASH